MSKIVKNYIYNMVYQVLVMILPLITTPYVSRILKPEGIGEYNYIYSIVFFIITVAQLGTNLYGQREIAFVQDDKEKRSVVFWEIVLIRLLATILVVPIYILLFLKLDEFRILLGCMAIYIFSNIFDVSWFYQGREEFKRIAIRNIAVKLIGVLFIFLFVHNEKDIVVYTIILAGTQLFGNLSLWIGIKKVNNRIVLKEIIIKRHVRPILELFFPTAAMYVYIYVDKIILGALSNSAEVGFYSQSEKIVKLLLTVITSLGAVLLPHISNAITQQKLEEIKKEILNAVKFVFFIGLPMVVGSIIISDRFIPFFLGSEYDECKMLFSLLSPLIIIIGLASVVGQAVLIPMKKQKMYSISIISGSIMNIVLNFLLIPSLGAVGASVGTIVAELTVTSIQLAYVSRLIDINILSLFFESYKFFIAAATMGILGYICSILLSETIIAMVIIVLVCIVVYFFVLFALQDGTVKTVFLNIKRKFII